FGNDGLCSFEWFYEQGSNKNLIICTIDSFQISVQNDSYVRRPTPTLRIPSQGWSAGDRATARRPSVGLWRGSASECRRHRGSRPQPTGHFIHPGGVRQSAYSGGCGPHSPHPAIRTSCAV